MTVKSDYWTIEYTAKLTADVVFDKPLDKTAAAMKFQDNDIEDIVDSEELKILSISSMKPID